MENKEQPPIKTIITEWIYSYGGKLSKDNDEKELALEQLVDTFLKYGYSVGDIKSATTRKWVLEECCPASLKGKVRDHSTWYHLTDRLWGRVLRARFPEIELADKRDKSSLQTPKSEKKESDIPKTVSKEPKKLDHGSLDRSQFKETAPKPNWNMDLINKLSALGVDPKKLGINNE